MANKIENIFYENGNIFKEYEVNTEGEIHGYLKCFHENGALKFKVNFTNNVQDVGEVITYHPDGSRARKITFINGAKNGEFFEWHENGKLKTQGTYNNDICHIEKEFDENGVEMEKDLKYIGDGNIREILKFLEANLECKIRFESYFTDYYYQLKEDNQYDENGVEMEKHLDNIGNGDIREILKFLETNLECKIRFESYFTDYYYQLKEDNQYDKNGPFTLNEEGSLLFTSNNRGLNISTKNQKSAIQAGQNYPNGYPINCYHGKIDLKKPFYWGDCYIWTTGILKNKDLINKIKEFLDEYDDMEEEEIQEEGWYLFVDDFLGLGSYPEEHLDNLESEGVKVNNKKQGFGTSFGMDNVSWCVMDKTHDTEISWIIQKNS